MILYFTATGNCLHMARQLDSACRSIAQERRRPERVYRAPVIGVVCPVYGHDVPPFIRDFLANSKFETDYLYFVLTYGFCHGGAPERIAQFMEEHGRRLDYVNTLLMVDNALPGFDIAEEVRKLPEKRTEEHLVLIAEDIRARRSYIQPTDDWSREYHEAFLKLPWRMDPDPNFPLFQLRDNCIGCGVCTRVCPMGCWKVQSGKAVQNPQECVCCLACIHNCPRRAIGMTVPEKNPEARYRHPAVSLADIIKANSEKIGGA